MKRVLLSAVLAAAVFVVGCTGSGGNPHGEGVPAEPALSVEESARLMLEALKTGDVDTFLASVDLRGIYETRFPEAMRKRFSFEQMEAAIKAARAKAVGQGAGKLQQLSYEIVGAEERGAFQVVTVRTQSRPGRPWRTIEAYFANIDGVWKLTGRGFERLKTD